MLRARELAAVHLDRLVLGRSCGIFILVCAGLLGEEGRPQYLWGPSYESSSASWRCVGMYAGRLRPFARSEYVRLNRPRTPRDNWRHSSNGHRRPPMKSIRSGWILFGLPIAVLAWLLTLPAWAQYPDRPIKLVIPYPPGGLTDLMARTLQQPLSELLV